MCNEDEQYLAGRAKTIAKMKEMCEWIPSEELVIRVDQPNARKLVTSWAEERRIFSAPSDRGVLYHRC